jgi:ankyrin repeat protein
MVTSNTKIFHNNLLCILIVHSITTFSIAQQTELDSSYSSSPAINVSFSGLTGNEFNIEKTFEVVLTNISQKPIFIKNPKTKDGFNQLKFHFTNIATGETCEVKKRLILDADFWKRREKSESVLTEIKATDSLAIQVRFNELGKLWNGLPLPNSDIEYTVSVEFISENVNRAREVWIGSASSKTIVGTIVSPSLKTPFDCLNSGFPRLAIQIMAEDKIWISRKDQSECTPLHVAASLGQNEVVSWVLENGADVNAVAYNRFTPLHLAGDNARVVKTLLDHDPDLTLACVSGKTAIEAVAAELNVTKDFLQKEKLKEVEAMFKAANAEQSSILNAVALNSLVEVKRRLKAHSEIDLIESAFRNSIQFGHIDICRYILTDLDFDPNYVSSEYKIPAIFDAVELPDIVKLLIQNQARLDFQTVLFLPDDNISVNATVLHLAAFTGKPQTMKNLIGSGMTIDQKADVNTTEEPWLKHSENGDISYTLFELAVKSGRVENLEFIFEQPTFQELGKSEITGRLNEALFDRAWNPIIVSALLKLGADPEYQKNEISCLERAFEVYLSSVPSQPKSIEKSMRCLLDAGAKAELRSAIALADEKMVNELINRSPECLSKVSGNGMTVLEVAVVLERVGIVDVLIRAKVDMEHRNSDGESALYLATYFDSFSVASSLVSAGANVNGFADNGNTPLHAAVLANSEKCAKLLLENGADTNAVNNVGVTPLDLLQLQNPSQVTGLTRIFKTWSQR